MPSDLGSGAGDPHLDRCLETGASEQLGVLSQSQTAPQMRIDTDLFAAATLCGTGFGGRGWQLGRGGGRPGQEGPVP